MKKIKLLLFIIFTLFLCSVTTFAYSYGNIYGLPNVSQFDKYHYVIYKNADTDRIELAIVIADDISERSLIAECEGKVEVTSINEVARGSDLSFGVGSGEEILLSENKKLFLSDTQNPYYIIKWYFDNKQWVKFTEAETARVICHNYSELLYSGFPVIEKINKEKTGRPYYRTYSGMYYVDYDWATVKTENGTEEYRYYAWFSKDGINVEKKVELPVINNGGIGGAYSGNGITILMGVPDMALSDFQRPAGFSSGCLYIFDENCNLITTREANGLQSCIGFYDGYFYFSSTIYVSKGQSVTEYSKSADGINYIDITQKEFQEVSEFVKRNLYMTMFGKYMTFEYDENSNVISYVSDYYNGDKKEIVYETDNEILSNDIAVSSALSGRIVRSKWKMNILSNNKEYITLDYIYKILLPNIDETKTSYKIDRCFWATDDYIYVDQDIEYIFRIPVSQFSDKIYVQLNDKMLAFDQSPVVENDRTLVPMRFLFEQMGAVVEWNGETKTAVAKLNDTEVAFSIDDTNAKVNNQSVTMDVPARLINGKTMVPLRFLSENLGYTITWDEETRTVVIE